MRSTLTGHLGIVFQKVCLQIPLVFVTLTDGNLLVAKVLIRRLLDDDPRHRATVYSALNSEWINSDLEKLQAAYQDRIIASLPPDERPKRRV